MKKILIIPYFGEFPNYYQFFLNSCEKNQNFNWLIITDNKREYRYPNNVSVINMTFLELKDKIQKLYQFKISLERPHKLCDYKPAYGHIFYEYISDYDWWGHCDMDLIFGDLNEYITDDLLKKYEKIFTWGHFTLYRNSILNNKRYLEKFEGKLLYEKCFSNDQNFIFDEMYDNSINNIYESLNIEIYDKVVCADIYTKSSNFKVIKDFIRNSKKFIVEKYRKNLFVYNNGKIYEYYKENNKLIKNEYMYIHLQKRKMKIKVNDTAEYYKIIPNSFEIIEVEKIMLENFNKIKNKNMNLHYFKLRIRNLKVKIMNIFRKKI